MDKYQIRMYSRYINDYLSKRRDISFSGLETTTRTFKAYFGHLLPKDKNLKILDIGCGYGIFLYFLKKEGYKNYFGIDCGAEQIEIARKFGIVNVRCCDVFDFCSNHKEEYDVIVALDLLEHFKKEEVLELLDKVYQSLKPRGVFILQTINAYVPFANRLLYEDFTHEVTFTEASLRHVLAVAGFEDIQIYPTRPIIHGIRSLARYCLWSIIEFLYWCYIIVELGVLKKPIVTPNLIASGIKFSEE